MTLTEINRKLATLSQQAKQTDQQATELRRAAAAAHARAKKLKERSDSVQRKLTAHA